MTDVAKICKASHFSNISGIVCTLVYSLPTLVQDKAVQSLGPPKVFLCKNINNVRTFMVITWGYLLILISHEIQNKIYIHWGES